MIPTLVILLLVFAPIQNIDLNVYHVMDWGNVEVELLPLKPRLESRFQQLTTDIASNIDLSTCVEGFCDAKSYPEEEIRSKLNQHTHFRNYFGQIVEPFVKVTDRDSGKANVDNMCKTSSKRKFPQIGMNTNGTYRYIVNLREEYEQSIKFEICEKGNHECRADRFNHLNTSCAQVYNVMRIVVLGESDNLALEHFKIPSTCACHYQSKDL